MLPNSSVQEVIDYVPNFCKLCKLLEWRTNHAMVNYNGKKLTKCNDICLGAKHGKTSTAERNDLEGKGLGFTQGF